MERNKTALLELGRTDEESIFREVREFQLQGLRDPEASTSEQREQGGIRHRPYRSLRGENVGASARPHAGAVSVLTGVTQEGSPSRAMVVPGQVRRPSHRQIRRSHRLRHDADKKWVILCCREKHRREVLAARTPNRLRWSGREYQGDRVNRG